MTKKTIPGAYVRLTWADNAITGYLKAIAGDKIIIGDIEIKLQPGLVFQMTVIPPE